jgi:hypothetical protein
MTAEDVYFKFLLKVNKNNTQGNINTPLLNFVLLYNEAQRKWFNRFVPPTSSDDVANVESSLKAVILKPINSVKEYSEYELPKDWFANADVFVLANKGKCKNQRINLRQINSINVRNYMFDDAQQPSFEYEWSFYTIEGSNIKVYKTDFDLGDLHFNYYKEPRELDIEGYIKTDGTPSTTVNPELADIFVDQIISEAAIDYMRNNENQLGVQIGQNRQNSENN